MKKLIPIYVFVLLSLMAQSALSQGSAGCSGYDPAHNACAIYSPGTCPTANCLELFHLYGDCSEGRHFESHGQCDELTQSQCNNTSGCQWLPEVLTVYKNYAFDGPTMNLPIVRQTYNSVDSGRFDSLHDQVSSVIVPSKTCLSLYTDRNWDGPVLTLQPGSHHLTDYAFDDYASSWSVFSLGTSNGGDDPCGDPDAILYWNANQGGDKFPLRLGEKHGKLGKFSDDASSVWVAPGTCLHLFRDTYWNGTFKYYTAGYHNLSSSGFDNQASSAIVVPYYNCGISCAGGVCN